MKIIVWKCELCGVTVPLRENGASVRKCTGGHPIGTRKLSPDHWPEPMVRLGELSGLPEDVTDEDTSGWAVLKGTGVTLAENDRLARQAADRRRSEGYRYLEVGRRLADAPGGAEAVG